MTPGYESDFTPAYTTRLNEKTDKGEEEMTHSNITVIQLPVTSRCFDKWERHTVLFCEMSGFFL